MSYQNRDRSNSIPSNEVSVAAAIFVGAAFLLVFIWLTSPANFNSKLDSLAQFGAENRNCLVFLTLSVLFNLTWIGRALWRQLGLRGQGAKLAYLKSAQKWDRRITKSTLVALAPIALISFGLAKRVFLLTDLAILPIKTHENQWFYLIGASLTLSGLGIFLLLNRIWIRLSSFSLRGAQLPVVPEIRDGIILGAIHEDDDTDGIEIPKSGKPEWVLMGIKGLGGNLLVTGVIGSGKSQILLRFLKQILESFTQRPALLAIDPKRTFVRELKKTIENQSKSDHLIWISLGGDVKFNPIWRERMLTRSSFITIANTLKLASINFLGSSGENRFWEQSSFNLLKNSLVYCAAKYDYFTFKELYQALIEAREMSLAAELVDYLSSKDWDTEEQANIEMAISYFKNEFSQMDQKVRTSILATATGFLNEFLEYQVSLLLSPQKEDITLFSMSEALREGKLILLYIENNALARSVGTLLKLMFEEAVLERVTHSNLAEAPYAILVMDEYQDVATSGGGAGLGDDRYLAMAREAKAITIAATQSVSSLENAIRSEPATRELLQNFRSRIFGNSTDPRTIKIFQEPRGTEEKERNSHSFSENAQNPTRDLLFGGFDSKQSTLSESIATHSAPEHVVTSKEFARLRTFEAYAQLFDGVETRFEKLFLKPYYLKDIRTSHLKILSDLRQSAKVIQLKSVVFSFTAVATLNFIVRLTTLALLILPAFFERNAHADILFPNVCSVVKTSEFRSCLDFSVSGCMCGWPVPRPCAQITYHVPQTFIEVWPNSKDSFFSTLPGAMAQLKLHEATDAIPFGIDDDQSSYAFQARSIPIPFAFATLMPLPCGETRIDKPCFDLMSEDLGKNWKTGQADSLQPQFLAWSLAPKACLLKGTATGIAGVEPLPSLGMDAGGCSFPLGYLPKFPPSPREACNGWGLFFPRSGNYDGGSRSIAALMIASRLKSLGTEVAHTIPGGPGETWQMIYPQPTSCFTEGQNPGVLEMTKGLREERRALGKPNGYLFVVWKKVSCCRDLPEVATTLAAITALSAACVVVPGGGT